MQRDSAWLSGLRTYLAVMLAGNLLWETLHLPLYTIWQTGSPREQAFAVLHCTGGDLLIGISTLTLALILTGQHAWPKGGVWPVAAVAIPLGVAYTAYSEWMNVAVRATWAYSEWMPIVSIGAVQLGVSPLLQWIVVPAAAAWIAHRRA